MHRWASAHICRYICVYGTHIYLQIQTPVNISLIKEQTEHNIGEVCINSLDWYDANTAKNKIIIIIKASYEISQGGYYTVGTVERLDGAKMSMQVPFEASDGSQVFE